MCVDRNAALIYCQVLGQELAAIAAKAGSPVAAGRFDMAALAADQDRTATIAKPDVGDITEAPHCFAVE